MRRFFLRNSITLRGKKYSDFFYLAVKDVVNMADIVWTGGGLVDLHSILLPPNNIRNMKPKTTIPQVNLPLFSFASSIELFPPLNFSLPVNFNIDYRTPKATVKDGEMYLSFFFACRKLG